MLLFGHMLSDGLVNGESRTFDILLRLFQRSAMTAMQRVVARYFQDALAGQFVGHLERIVKARFPHSTGGVVTRGQRELRLLRADLFHDVLDDGLRHRPAESFHHIIAEQRLARLGEVLQLIIVAAMASLTLLAGRETLVVFRILVGYNDIRNETLLQLLRHLLLPQTQLRQFHDGGHAVGTSSLMLDARILMPLFARFFEEPRAAAGARRRRIHRRRRLRLGVFAGVARTVRLRFADGLATSPHSVQKQFRPDFALHW